MYSRPNSSEVVVVLPALNESDGVGLTIKDALHSLLGSRVLVVDGRSIDGTNMVASGCGATVLAQSGQGKGAAIRESLEYLKRSSQKPSWLVLCDADHTYPLESSPQMLDLIARDPSIGMVIGNRFSQFKPRDYLRDRYVFGNLLLRRMHRLLNGAKLQDPLSGLRVVRFEAVEGLQLDSDGFDFETELNIRMLSKGWRIYEVPIKRRERIGKKKLRVRDGFAILARMMKHSFGRET